MLYDQPALPGGELEEVSGERLKVASESNRLPYLASHLTEAR